MSLKMNSKEIRTEDYKNKPAWLKAGNKVFKGFYYIKGKPVIRKDALIRSARKMTKLNDLGKEFDDQALEILLRSVNEEADLHPLGHFITKQRFINLLAVRLRAEDLFKKHPEILAQELYPVTLITGLQRTGTTKLHRLLAADPDNRTLLSWEAINPAPLNEKDLHGKERIKIAQKNENALKKISPGFFAIHPVIHNAPEEDVLLLDVSFMSQTPEATMHVPSYSSWLESTNQSPAYEYLVKLLKLLQWQRTAKRWVLKTPNHLENLELVKKHLNAPLIIWTHRDPVQSIPSFLSMVTFARAFFSDRVDPRTVADHWLKKSRLMLNKGIELYTGEHYKNRFLHILYEDQMNDPAGILKKIYKRLNEPVSKDKESLFLKTEKANDNKRYGKHTYSTEYFGLSDQHLRNYLKDYEIFRNSLF
jgi:hypothetical protein